MKLFEARRAATLEDVSWLRKALRRRFAELRIGADIADEIVLAVAELAANLVSHAAPAPRELALEAVLDGIVLTLTIEDDGGPFDAFESKWARASLAGVEDGTSGRGLALARRALDRVTYSPGPPNRLTARRQLSRRRPLLLVVEDEDLLLETYMDLLEPHYRVLAARTLPEALALARDSTVDLILTDFHLGTEPGTALVTALEDDSERLPVPIVMITGDSSVRVQALEFGVDTFLTKPVQPTALLETVKLALLRATRQRARLLRYFGLALEKLVRPALPERLGPFNLALQWETADIGGGDLVVHLPRAGADRIVLADIMGHGIDAKAGAVAQAAMIRALDVGAQLGPSHYLTRWSNLVFSEPGFDAAMATALVIDLWEDGAIEIASAGHPYPTLISRGGVRSVVVDGPLLGFAPNARYESVQLRLEWGDRLLLATDGLDPAELASGGACPDWLIAVIQANARKPLRTVLRNAGARITDRLGPDPEDDWTLVLIEGISAAQRAGALPSMALPPPDMPAIPPGPRLAAPVAEPDPSASAALAAAPDPSGVGALRRAVGEDSFRGLALRFVDNATRRFGEWEDLVAEGDAEALTPTAHAFAGVLGQFGLTATAALVRQVEHETDPAMRLALARQVAAQGRPELVAFQAWLDSPPSETV
ncbi:SpoIIE family protein phosphatase [Aquabacter spiritensis]|uniref:Serine/threonine-protein kinase RsbW n=1 Tax=Aquabacter spiritensis TaxID=933073 RepID=A0A4R3LZ01_9HYPH|nr:SpoIIE family protein phosphatase [Aquabacter spiritensis]TCT05964.1 serine/threonine-protein kinase RsbW [Aquabacter spiritensis]